MQRHTQTHTHTRFPKGTHAHSGTHTHTHTHARTKPKNHPAPTLTQNSNNSRTLWYTVLEVVTLGLVSAFNVYVVSKMFKGYGSGLRYGGRIVV